MGVYSFDYSGIFYSSLQIVRKSGETVDHRHTGTFEPVLGLMAAAEEHAACAQSPGNLVIVQSIAHTHDLRRVYASRLQVLLTALDLAFGKNIAQT